MDQFRGNMTMNTDFKEKLAQKISFALADLLDRRRIDLTQAGNYAQKLLLYLDDSRNAKEFADTIRKKEKEFSSELARRMLE